MPKRPSFPTTPEKQSAWMLEQLEQVAQRARLMAIMNSEEKVIGFGLEPIIKRLKEVFEPVSFEPPKGKSWKGSKLPPSILTASLPKKGTLDLRGDLLAFAVECDAPLSVIRWCIASGFDPTAYNPEAGRAALGRMAYAARWEMVKLCVDAGFDPTLRVLPHHHPEIDPTSSKGWVLGSSLLHRMARRYYDEIDGNEGKVLSILLDAGLDPLEKTMSGHTAFDLAQDAFALEILKQWKINRDEALLQSNTPSGGHGGPKTRL